MTFAHLDSAILAYLRKGNVLTPASAMSLFGCAAMHSCASRLRKQGHGIKCVMKNGHGVYSLTAPQDHLSAPPLPGPDKPAGAVPPHVNCVLVKTWDAKGKPFSYMACQEA